jgi:IS5 family transposase
VHDATCAEALLEGLQNGAVVVADKGYDADSIRTYIRHQGAVPNIPNRSNRKTKFRWNLMKETAADGHGSIFVRHGDFTDMP